MKSITIVSFMFFLNIIPLFAQDTAEDEIAKRHSLAFVFSYTHIPEATKEGETEKAIFVPTIGLDYFYKLNEKWILGGVFDVELGRYEVDFKEEEISREIAIIMGAVIGYEILPAWAIMTGPGIEIEKNKNLFVLRFSTEYAFELGNDWELFPNFTYDFKKEYGSYAFGLGIKKRF